MSESRRKIKCVEDSHSIDNIEFNDWSGAQKNIEVGAALEFVSVTTNDVKICPGEQLFLFKTTAGVGYVKLGDGTGAIGAVPTAPEADTFPVFGQQYTPISAADYKAIKGSADIYLYKLKDDSSEFRVNPLGGAMTVKPDKLIKSLLGEDFFEELQKSADVYKMYNRNATSIDEIATGLKIVPRAVMSFLISSLSHLEAGDGKDLELPFAPECYMQITKKDRDTYSGYIYSKGKKINEFTNRSIPGVGLVLMTSFELYDTENLKDSREQEKEAFNVSKLQDVIDERLRLHTLISRVVDQKLAQRDAVEILVKEKLKQALAQQEQVQAEETKSEKLKKFLQQQKRRTEEAQIEKTESISCPDCGTGLYDGGKNLTLCICYGEDWNKNIKIQKTESNIKMKFPKSMDAENIEMLLNTLKHNNKE